MAGLVMAKKAGEVLEPHAAEPADREPRAEGVDEFLVRRDHIAARIFRERDIDAIIY